MNAKLELPKPPPAETIRVEMATLKTRLAELRALLRFAESCELARKVHAPDESGVSHAHE